MFALIIGIDEYANIQRLRGAVADANAMKEYLERDLRVPTGHIRTLLNQEATRSAIIDAFTALRDDSRIEEGDPIVIFYAGHGAAADAPTDWGVKGDIQCLVPQDYDGADVYPILDRSIGALIEKIAKARGDNISVIFDCCCSASGTRVDDDEEGYARRTVRLDTVIPLDLDEDIWGRAGKVSPGFAYHGLQSHVLLAACGENEFAQEYNGHGLFTTALLETLRKCAIDHLTYNDVLERIHLNKQHPHCEGSNRHRVMFDTTVPAGRQVRYSVSVGGGGGGGAHVIGAGLAQGVSRGVEFTLYSDQNRVLGVVVVDDTATIEDFQTTIPAGTSELLANPSFAKLTRVGDLPVYLAPAGNPSWPLEETLRRIDANGTAARFRLVKDIEEAKLEVTMESDLVVLKILDQNLKQFGLAELSFKTALDRLSHVLSAAAHFYWYLDLAKENGRIDATDGVTVDFYLLRESESVYDDYGLSVFLPDGPGFCRRDHQYAETPNVIDFVVDPDGSYGIKLTNNTNRDLYFNAFLFNNTSLRIVPCYTQSDAGSPEAPLKRGREFTIGYGPGGMPPFTYSLEEDQDIDVGHLKFFFATRPVDLTDIIQLSPFSSTKVDEDAYKARSNASPSARSTTRVDTWFALDIPVVQRRWPEEVPPAV